MNVAVRLKPGAVGILDIFDAQIAAIDLGDAERFGEQPRDLRPLEGLRESLAGREIFPKLGGRRTNA